MKRSESAEYPVRLCEREKLPQCETSVEYNVVRKRNHTVLAAFARLLYGIALTALLRQVMAFSGFPVYMYKARHFNWDT